MCTFWILRLRTAVGYDHGEGIVWKLESNFQFSQFLEFQKWGKNWYSTKNIMKFQKQEKNWNLYFPELFRFRSIC